MKKWSVCGLVIAWAALFVSASWAAEPGPEPAETTRCGALVEKVVVSRSYSQADFRSSGFKSLTGASAVVRVLPGTSRCIVVRFDARVPGATDIRAVHNRVSEMSPGPVIFGEYGGGGDVVGYQWVRRVKSGSHHITMQAQSSFCGQNCQIGPWSMVVEVLK